MFPVVTLLQIRRQCKAQQDHIHNQDVCRGVLCHYTLLQVQGFSGWIKWQMKLLGISGLLNICKNTRGRMKMIRKIKKINKANDSSLIVVQWHLLIRWPTKQCRYTLTKQIPDHTSQSETHENILTKIMHCCSWKLLSEFLITNITNKSFDTD